MGIKFGALYAVLKCYTTRCALSAFVLEAGREPAAVSFLLLSGGFQGLN